MYILPKKGRELLKYPIVKAVSRCSRFAREGETTDCNLVKNQSRRHAKKLKCSSTSKRVRVHKSRQKTLRLDNHSKSLNLFTPPVRAKQLQWKTAFKISVPPS